MKQEQYVHIVSSELSLHCTQTATVSTHKTCLRASKIMRHRRCSGPEAHV
jgi:hypothetical protein